jgi:hypothetical protein
MLPRVPKGARGVKHRITERHARRGDARARHHRHDRQVRRGRDLQRQHADETVAKAANLAAELAADEDQFLTTAAAALPNDGTIIVVETEYTID